MSKLLVTLLFPLLISVLAQETNGELVGIWKPDGRQLFSGTFGTGSP